MARRRSSPSGPNPQDSLRSFLDSPTTGPSFPALSTAVALALGAIAARDGGGSAAGLAWCGLVGATALALAATARAYRRRLPPRDRLLAAAWAKAGATAAHGLAWGLGPLLLRDAVHPVSVLAPAWALPVLAAALGLSCASFPPGMAVAVAATLAPPALVLGRSTASLDAAAGLGLAVALPVVLAIGVTAARGARAAVLAQAEIASLLARMRDGQRERATFYSAAAHDLRQPVHALGLYAAMLRSADDPGERREIESRLVDCAASLDRQFNAILGVTQADRAAERAAARAIPAARILETVTAGVRPEADRKGLRLRSPPTGLHVLADPDALERILLNLAVNAVRYTERGGVVIGARASGDEVRFIVADSGIGIAAAQRDRIFEDFYQVDNAGRRRERGFGLGLAIVRRLCAAMDWRLDLSSMEGRGSVFSVSVPRVPTPEPGEAEGAGQAPPRCGEASALARDVVLLVDDDPLVREATARALARWNRPAIVCEGGEAALAALSTRRPHEPWHALVDVRLRDGEDGLALAERLVAAADADFRVTLMSGDFDPDLAARAAALGFELLRKPLKPVRLRALLSRPLDLETAP